MTRKEFIEKFGLTKTTTKCSFRDGGAAKSRTLYVDNNGDYFTFYNNDLYTFKAYETRYEGMPVINGKLGAGYSWYH